MLATLTRKEIVSHVLSLRFGVTFILFILLVFASLYVTVRKQERDIAQYNAAGVNAAEQLAKIMEEKEADDRFWRLMDEGRVDAVPVPPLAVVAQGVKTALPLAVQTNRQESRSLGEGIHRNLLSGLVRIPDLVYIVSVVLSLLAILFAFDSICGEKESGTLRLMLSNAVPRDQVLLGKWLGGYVMLFVPFLIAFVGGLGYAWHKGALELSGETLQRLGMLLLLAAMYISVFFTLSLCISTLTHKAATALFLCLLIWVVWILVIPNLAPVLAKIFSPSPSVEKIAAEKRAVDKEIDLRKSRVTLLTGELGYSTKVQLEKDKLSAEGEQRKSEWDRFLDSQVREQTDLAQSLGRLSPAACWTFGATTLMGTGAEDMTRFSQLRRKLQDDFKRFYQDGQRKRNLAGKYQEFRAEDVPHLATVSSTFSDVMTNARVDFIVLAVLNVLLFLLAFMTFLRYDVR